MSSRYNNNPLIPFVETGGNKILPIQRSVRYPELPHDVNDIYAFTTLGDRLDLLAQQFYGDTNLYWIIACANPDKVGFSSLFINEGSEIRIPANVSQIKSLYNRLNTL